MDRQAARLFFRSITLLYFYFFVFSLQLYASPNSYCASVIKQLLDKYTRPFTVLEIGFSTTDYLFNIASAYSDSSCVTMLFKDVKSSLTVAYKGKYTNVIVLNPLNLCLEQLITLGRCEHFDVIIVKDIARIVAVCGEQAVTALLKFGDYSILDLQHTHTRLLDRIDPNKVTLHKSTEGIIAVCSMQKKGLDIARWTQKLPVSRVPRYFVQSSFHEKLFYKTTIDKATNWIKGINLVTFVMLRGIYPSDNLIRQNLVSLNQRFPEYNDGVIGNMIIDGSSLKLIDFDDKRRHANMKKCIDKALKVFNSDQTRLLDPQRRLKDYYRSL